MKKITQKLIALGLGLITIIGTFQVVYADSSIGISINGKIISSDVSPVMENGRTLVPIRVISENLGAEVTYDANTKQVTVKKDNSNMSLTLNQKLITVNGRTETIDVPAKVVKGRTLVPIRVISENLNCKVVWDANKKMVIITTDGAGGSTDTGSDVSTGDVDPWGRPIRTTNLPKGAEYFPYICADVPNWAYEEIVAYMKNTNGRAVWSGFGKDKFGWEFPAWTESAKNTPKDFWNSQYSVEAYYDRIKKYLDFCVNIDYRTITREQIAEIMNETFTPDSIKDINASIDFWYNYYKNNKIIVSGDVTVIPEGFHMTEEGRPVVAALITLKVSSQKDFPNDYANIAADRKQEGFQPPRFETNVTYQGVFINPMNWYSGDANSYQLSYNYALFDMRDFRKVN